MLQHLLSLGCVTNASLGKASYGKGLALTVTSKGSSQTEIAVGDIFSIRHDRVQKCYPSAEVGEWEVSA